MASMFPPLKGFDKGIKPTRLWHLMDKRHFEGLQRDLFRIRPPFQPNKKQQLLVHAIVLGSTFGLAFAFGKYVDYFSPPPPPPPPPIKKEKKPEPGPNEPMCICEIPEDERTKKEKKEKKCKRLQFKKDDKSQSSAQCNK